ncbi:hypothetical protein MMC25_004126 [Agyrium rufum]|nr:hypothetical protein [Agyrium rufum]
MGGKAFALHRDPSLPTPRMAPNVYFSLRDSLLAKIGAFSQYVATPTEAPGKTSYGDFDILVAEPLSEPPPASLGENGRANLPTLPNEGQERRLDGKANALSAPSKARANLIEKIAELINAKATISDAVSINFAVPYPRPAFTNRKQEPPYHEEPHPAGPSSNPLDSIRDDQWYVQVDLHICSSLDLWRWEVFHNSHGDLWNLLGTSIRPFGLMANATGLFLRLKEIEHLDRKKSLVFLTREPNVICDVLQLHRPGIENFAAPFTSAVEMFTFVAGGRLFRRESYVRGDLKANDRKRLKQRDMYREFVDKWLPLQGQIKGMNEKADVISRDQIFREMVETFDIARDVEDRLTAWSKERAEITRRQVQRALRKAEADRNIAYADAWIEALNAA